MKTITNYADNFSAAVEELATFVDERLPARFYRSAPSWQLYTTAMLARAVDTLRTIAMLLRNGKPTDARVLTRALYELAVTFCWILIDPEPHALAWLRNTSKWRAVLHDETSQRYGIEILRPEELAARPYRRYEIPPLDQRADQVDAYWSERLAAFRSPTKRGHEDLRTLRGLYTAIYRTASRAEHAQADGLNGYLDDSRYPIRVVYEDSPEPGNAEYALPLVALMIFVGQSRLGWPAEDRTRHMVEPFLD